MRSDVLAGGTAMERQQPERPDRRDDAFRLRLAIGVLLLGLLLYGCWQAVAGFAASFPKNFR